MTYKQLRDELNKMNPDQLEEDINIQHLNNIIHKPAPKAASVGNNTTNGFSNLFGGTSWGR
jgi:hypothetical protein